jgi:uncharacterized phage-like protein YoqJ
MLNLMYYCTIGGSTVWELPYGQNESHPDCVALKHALLERISELCDKGLTDFVVNCEYGIPMWAAEAIVAIRGFRENHPRLHILAPHENQAVKWHDDVHERYYNLHATADSVTVLRTQYTDDCYQEADRFMLNHSVMLLTDGGNEGLTEYAKSKNKHIEQVSITTPR